VLLNAFHGKKSGIVITKTPMHKVDVHPGVYAELKHSSESLDRRGIDGIRAD